MVSLGGQPQLFTNHHTYPEVRYPHSPTSIAVTAFLAGQGRTHWRFMNLHEPTSKFLKFPDLLTSAVDPTDEL